MNKKKISQIQKQYRFEAENNAYLIEVLLDDFDDVYDEWDPAPFKKRFIEEEFNDFIITSAEDIPAKHNIIIALYLPENKKDLEKEQAVVSAYRNFYAYATAKENKSSVSLRKKNIYYFILSMFLLGISYLYLSETENIFLNIVREGLFIGGWVFLWEVITNIFIISREISSRRNLYLRLYESEIRFVYQSDRQK
ncbi:MAG: hypothetical protein K0S47_2662 [Herbinix sp.]|jgi:hypothetical protein|nr:hypothetical protein [Herbinix sp.]